jgi:hypothetical protein
VFFVTPVGFRAGRSHRVPATALEIKRSAFDPSKNQTALMMVLF